MQPAPEHLSASQRAAWENAARTGDSRTLRALMQQQHAKVLLVVVR